MGPLGRCRDVQLKLWYTFAAGRHAERTIIALHSQLGRVLTSREAAIALGCASSDNLAKCLHDGQVCCPSYSNEHSSECIQAFPKPVSVH